MSLTVSAAPKPPIVEHPGSIEQPDLIDGVQIDPAPAATLALVPAPASSAPTVAPVDVVMCCAARDLPRMGRVFDALAQHGCAAVAMTKVEADTHRLTESVRMAGRPRLYVVCKTPSVDSLAARRMVQAFARAGRRGRHQLPPTLDPAAWPIVGDLRAGSQH